MNPRTRSFFSLITAATAVAALAAGLMLAISAPAPATEEFSPAVVASATSDDSLGRQAAADFQTGRR